MRAFNVRDISPTTCGGELHEHIVRWIKNPDEGSAFERKTRYLRRLPGWALVRLLSWFNYGGVVCMHDDRNEVIGHVFHQERGDTLHLFSIWVNTVYRNAGVGPAIAREWLLHAHRRTTVCRIQTGLHEGTLAILRRACDGRMKLPFKLIPGTTKGSAHIIR